MNKAIPVKPDDVLFNDDQWKAIHLQGGNILVAASAGSGKTLVLIERILNHLASQYVAVDELLVVTFTELAAKEMKERLESRMKQAINDASTNTDRRFYLSQMQKLPSADIRTLHSFCLTVIEKFFYLIDFNPSFDLITDETELTLIYQIVWEELLSEIYSEEGSATLNRQSLFELLAKYTNARNDEGLYELVVELYNFSSSHSDPVQWLLDSNNSITDYDKLLKSPIYRQGFKTFLLNALMGLIKDFERGLYYLHSLTDETVEKYSEIFQSESQFVHSLYETVLQDDLQAFIEQVQTMTFLRWPRNTKKSEDYDAVNDLKIIRDETKNNLEKIAQIFPYDSASILQIEKELTVTIDQIIQLTIAFHHALMTYKRSINRIDYNDLEHLTLEILAPLNPTTHLREVSIAGQYYQNLFKEVLIDEYQDINEIQGEILNWLSREYTEQPGNQFMVGDVKQSIYGFRMADPELFLTKYLQYGNSSKDHLIILDENFRSRNQVLQFTNFVFERLMDQSFGSLEYDRRAALKTGNVYFKQDKENSAYDIHFLIYNKESVNHLEQEPENLLANTLDYQAHLIAQDIYQRVQKKELIYDKAIEGERPVTYQDFVILSSTRGPFLALQRALEYYEIPLMSQKIESFFQRQEIQLMLALLKLIDNPLQDIPLVAILRSYFVGLSDEELSQIRIYHQEGLFFEAVQAYLQDEQNDSNIRWKLSNFMDQLYEWQELSRQTTIVNLIWDIYQKTHFLDYVIGLSNGVQRQANLHAFYEKARDFDDYFMTGLFGFIQYIEAVLKQENDLSEPILLGAEDNYVRLMTVHASKGLEFPIVYLMNTERAFNMQDVNRTRYTMSKKYGLATDLYNYQDLLVYASLSRELVKITREQELKEEEMRKLYVALTRCEQRLIIVGTVDDQERWEESQSKIAEISDLERLIINTQARQAANNWLTWLSQTLAIPQNSHSVAEFSMKEVKVRFIEASEILEQMSESGMNPHVTQSDEWIQRLITSADDPVVDTEFTTYLADLMNATYSYGLATRTSSYQSVSELKRLYEEPPIEKLAHYTDRSALTEATETSSEDPSHIQSIRYTEDTFREPDFIASKKIDAAMIGTITHFILQEIKFDRFKNLASSEYAEELNRQLLALVQQRSIDHQQVAVINKSSILNFLTSDFGVFLTKYFSQLRKEQAFSLMMPAKQLFQREVDDLQLAELANDQVLIHGVVDGIVKTPQGLILLDYKTDRYRPYGSATQAEQIEIIQQKYKFQMSLYKKAIELAENQPVIRTELVLLDFGLTITMHDLYEL